MEINYEFLLNDYTIENKIGQGNFGSIYKIKENNKDNFYAMKRLYLNIDYNNRELDNLLNIDNENCIKLYYYTKIPIEEYINFLNKFKFCTKFYNEETNEFLKVNKENIKFTWLMISDYYNVNLNQFIKSNIFIENKLFYTKIIFQSVANGLKYIKDKNMIHRDIKCDNILIKLNNEKEIKVAICDFGSAKFIPKEDKMTGIAYICSRPYRAPELLLGLTNYNYKIDIWSLGCLFFKILKGNNIFYQKDTKKMLRAITNVLGPPQKKDIEGMGDKRDIKVIFEYEIETIEEKLKDFPKEYVHLVKELLKWNPLERIELEDLLNLIEKL